MTQYYTCMPIHRAIVISHYWVIAPSTQNRWCDCTIVNCVALSGFHIGPCSSHHRVWIDGAMTRCAMTMTRWRDDTTVRWRWCDDDQATLYRVIATSRYRFQENGVRCEYLLGTHTLSLYLNFSWSVLQLHLS